jgi:hypothetical protein
VSALDVSCGAEADAAKCALFHVVIMGLVCLDIGSKGENGMFGGVDVLAGEKISWGVLTSHSVIGGKGIEPEYCVFDEMYKDNSGKPAEREHAVGATGALLYSADVLVDVRDMFVGSGGVKNRIPWAEDFKFVVGIDGNNDEPAGGVEM